jgi:hypothetical protein
VTTDLVLLTEEGNAPMLRNLILAVAVTSVLTMSPGRADEQEFQKAKKVQGIQAVVRGTLHFESGRGYFLSMQPVDKAGRETRVWLQVPEDKALVRELQGLKGREVIATGDLAQMPQDVGASVPPMGMYLEHGFRIKRAGAK